MHRVHHSVENDECNSNFGFSLTWWDRLFGTYCVQARAPQESMVIGLRGHTSPQDVARLDGMLMMPFKTQADGYSINRRQRSDQTLTSSTRH
jgi:sterol desaturase/sphingolipid hydroxylase (fatty acid hydroxylase superfamily)